MSRSPCARLCLALALLPGLAPRLAAAPAPVAAVVVTDTSGSMTEPASAQGTPFEQAIAAASLFFAGCDPSIAPGLIAFDSDIRVLTDRLQPATHARRAELLAMLGRLQ